MFRNEDEFQAFFIQHFGRGYLGNDLFAKVSRIAGNSIQSEIDVLNITPITPRQVIDAFEFKVLNNEKMGINYKRIYSGIGQAFSYFRYGVDRSYLVIGLSDNTLENRDTLLIMIKTLGKVMMYNLRLDRFGLIMYDEFLREVWHSPPYSLSGRFTRNNIPRDFVESIELARDNLLALNFSKRRGNNFFRKYGLNQYIQ